jgi:preprotein translocase subunit Sec61beta
LRNTKSGMVSYETSFDSKQPKLEPKLVSTLSETVVSV